MSDEKPLKNHQVTICLAGGAILGPFKATWGGDAVSDVRELTKDYDAFLQGEPQTRFKYHLHDSSNRFSHTLILNFSNVTAIYDQVNLTER